MHWSAGVHHTTAHLKLIHIFFVVTLLLLLNYFVFIFCAIFSSSSFLLYFYLIHDRLNIMPFAIRLRWMVQRQHKMKNKKKAQMFFVWTLGRYEKMMKRKR